MNWDAVGAIGEIVGAAAVFLSLIYLATQIRLDSAQQQRQGIMDAVSHFVAKYQAATETPEKARRFCAGLDDYESIDTDEKREFYSSMLGITVGFATVWNLHSGNVLDEEIFKAMERSFIGLCRCKGARQLWIEMAQYYPPGFVEYVNHSIGDETIATGPLNESISALKQ